jgi:hypothetical protein
MLGKRLCGTGTEYANIPIQPISREPSNEL